MCVRVRVGRRPRLLLSLLAASRQYSGTDRLEGRRHAEIDHFFSGARRRLQLARRL